MQLKLTLSFVEKRCTKCGAWLPLDAFTKNTKAPDGLHYWCRACVAIANQAYKATPEGKVAAARARARYNRKQSGEELEPLVRTGKSGFPPRMDATRPHGNAYRNAHRRPNRPSYVGLIRLVKAEIGCQVCGERDPVCLQYHHRDPATKRFMIGRSSHKGDSLARIIEEMVKCHILCANCHLRHHRGGMSLDALPTVDPAVIRKVLG